METEEGTCNLLDSSSDSDSDSDSNWKKKSTRNNGSDGDSSSRKKKRAHEMWTENLNEQMLLEGFGQCKLKKPSLGVFDRGCESYDFSVKPLTPQNGENDTDDKSENEQPDMDFGYDYNQQNEKDDVEEFGVVCEKKKIKTPKVKERLGDKSFGKFSIQKVAERIVHKLKEKNSELIQRCVQFLGAKKALELLSMTLTVEEAGGLMTKDGSRRRTPGGVYLQLLREDMHIRKDVMDKIFQDEKKAQNELKKAQRKMARKQKMKRQNAKERKTPMIPAPNPNANGDNATVALVENACSDIEEGEILE